MSIIPLRPEPDDIQLSAEDKDTVAFAVIFGASNTMAFTKFHPEFLNEKGRLNPNGRKKSNDFWQLAKVQNFKDAYTAYLQDWLGKEHTTDDETAEISEDKKRKTISKMLNQLVKLIGSGNLTGEDLKVYSEIMKKVGWLKDEAEEQEKPRRYLPAKCHTECAYRLFVESHIEGGEIEQECDYCRTRKFAEENGWHFDPTKNLDLPQEDK